METSALRITLVQSAIHWEQPESNRAHFTRLLENSSPADIIVLPEMFTTGFSMNAGRWAEGEEGETLDWMQKLAREKNAVITGSVMISDSDKFYNRLFWVRPNGTYETYDKRHLFSFAGEDNAYTAGNKRLIVEHQGWKICPMICYDLRFPVWSRNADLQGEKVPHVYDVLIYVANWPHVRSSAWSCLLEARAHENQCYVVGLNRIGEDGNGIHYSGQSVVHSPKGGQPLWVAQESVEQTTTVILDYNELAGYREKFGAWRDKDTFRLVD